MVKKTVKFYDISASSFEKLLYTSARYIDKVSWATVSNVVHRDIPAITEKPTYNRWPGN